MPPLRFDRHPNGRYTAKIMQRLGVTEDFVAVRTQHDRFTDLGGSTVQGHKNAGAPILDAYPPFGPDRANPTAANRLAQLTGQDALNVMLVPRDRVADVIRLQHFHAQGHSWITFPLRTALERGAQIYPDTAAVWRNAPWRKPVILGLPEGTRLAVDITSGDADRAAVSETHPPSSTTTAQGDDFGMGLVPGAHGWTKVSGQRGSPRGDLFRDPHGTDWHVRTPLDANHARNDVLATMLYSESGFGGGTEVKLISMEGRLTVASSMPPDVHPLSPDLYGMAADSFVADSWLANWDIARAGNLMAMHVANGPPIGPFRIDVGGALLYRALGEPKGAGFGSVVGELDSLRDARINPAAARLFRDVSNVQIIRGIQRIESIPDARIRELVASHGPGTRQERETLAETLIARKRNLVDQLPRFNAGA